MRNILIFGGLAVIGYALYNKFYKKDNKVEPKKGQTQPEGCGVAGCGDIPNPNIPIKAKSNLGLGGLLSMDDIDTTKPNVIDSAVVPKKGKFTSITPNRPIGRPRKSNIDLLTGNCQCIKAPCNC